MFTRFTKINLHGEPMDITEVRLEALFSQFDQVAEVEAVAGKRAL